MHSGTSADDAVITLSEARIESVLHNNTRPSDDSSPDQLDAYDEVIGESDNGVESSAIRAVVSDLLSLALQAENYEPSRCKKLCEQLARDALERISRVQFPQPCSGSHKYVVVVSIGSVASRSSAATADNGGTVYFGSRCLWNGLTDHFTSVKFGNSSLYAIASVFTVHRDVTSKSKTIQC